jgi:hypothetical protein
MILGGVFKNILLVLASVIFWGTIITPMQLFGYSIATAGLIYYGVGYDGLVTYYAATSNYAKRIGGVPSGKLIRRVILVATIFFLLVTGVAVSGNTPEFFTERLPPY